MSEIRFSKEVQEDPIATEMVRQTLADMKAIRDRRRSERVSPIDTLASQVSWMLAMAAGRPTGTPEPEPLDADWLDDEHPEGKDGAD